MTESIWGGGLFVGGVVCIFLILSFIDRYREKKRRIQNKATMTDVDAEMDAVMGYQEPTTTLEEISDQLSVIELKIDRIKTEVTTIGVIIIIAVAWLYFR